MLQSFSLSFCPACSPSPRTPPLNPPLGLSKTHWGNSSNSRACDGNCSKPHKERKATSVPKRWSVFQSALRSLPDHLHEDYLADHLKRYIADNWQGKFTPAELREGTALYLNCLRKRLLKVDGYADLVARLAILRTDERTEQILAIVKELLELVRDLIAKERAAQSVIASLFTIPPKLKTARRPQPTARTVPADLCRAKVPAPAR